MSVGRMLALTPSLFPVEREKHHSPPAILFASLWLLLFEIAQFQT
jgi:hypothetical protein